MADHPRLTRERKTIFAMTQIYCRDQHGSQRGALCEECSRLFAYAMERLDHCPYQERKPTCVHCPIHCYQKTKREQVRVMMRYAGPKMMLRHPILAVRHLMDGRVEAPVLEKRRTASKPDAIEE